MFGQLKIFVTPEPITPDFGTIRNTPEFQALMREFAPQQQRNE